MSRNTLVSLAGRWRLLAALAIAVGAVAVNTGCYKRVVGAQGPGADAYDIYEPNLKSPDDSVLPQRTTVQSKTVPTKKAKE
jgi:hypothetical protein